MAGETSGSHDARHALVADTLALPPGASVRATRMLLARDGETVLGFTRGPFRPYLHPVLTPSGCCVSAERPADHPHHAGLWIAADRVIWKAAGGPDEPHTYNFYVDEVFQGRAPGTIEQLDIDGDDRGRVVQQHEWRGPREWGAPDGRVVLAERRETRVSLVDGGHVIDVASTLRAVGGTVAIGPTRHAYFNARVADTMSLAGGGRAFDADGRRGGAAISGADPDWVCYSGPLGGGRHASLAVLAAPDSGRSWFAADWGVLSVGPCRDSPIQVTPDESRRLRYRVVVLDDMATPDEIAVRYEDYLRKLN